jgi:hypothetical protein
VSASRLLVCPLVVLTGALPAHSARAATSPLGPTKHAQEIQGDGQGALMLVGFEVPRSFTARPGSGSYELVLAAAAGRPRRWYQIEADPAVAGGCRADAASRVPPYGRIAATFAGKVLYAVFHKPLEGAMLFFPAARSCVEFSLVYKEGAAVNEPKLLAFARWFAGTVHVRSLG